MVTELKTKIKAKIFDYESNLRWILLLAVVVIFTIILYPSLVIQKHSYKIGDVVTKDLKAPEDFFCEDLIATALNREKAVEEVLTVYDYDPRFGRKMIQRIRQAFDELNKVSVQEVQSQQENSDNTLEAIPNAQTTDKPEFSSNNKVKIVSHDLVWKNKELFQQHLGIEVSRGAYKILIEEAFSPEISELITKILAQIMENGVVANKETLLKETGKGITMRNVVTQKERFVINLKQFFGQDQANAMVRIIGQPLLKKVNYNLVNLIVDFSQRLIQPNISLNINETEDRKKKALNTVKPVLYKIKAGEMLLREGERVNQIKLLKIKALQSQSLPDGFMISSLGAAVLLTCLLMVVYILYLRNQRRFNIHHNKNLLFISLVLLLTLFIVKISVTLGDSITPGLPFLLSKNSIIFGIPIASGAMIVCLLLGMEIAGPMAMVIAICVTFMFQGRLEIFLFFLINSTVGAYWVTKCRERNVIIKAGLKLGLLNILIVTAINIFADTAIGLTFLWDWAFAFSAGITSGILVLGIAPLIELGFGFTTDITLLELANVDRPILHRLMIEAPGTYHHSVIVGSLVEAAAAEIGANPLLAKVCGYYHDIGKLKKPLYYIENQGNTKNKHDKLAPSMSALILIAHIKDGVEIARQNKLGQEIIDTINQHHGTSLISYFYEKARKLKGDDAVNIGDFRYPGPKPQTIEAGLVMLADVVEAASRALDNPTPSRIQGLVQNLINKIFSDGQLSNCELTLKDLHSIAKSFNKILNGIHHHRIEYPDNKIQGNGKRKNGSSDRKSTNNLSYFQQNSGKKSTAHLKRLGLY